MLSYFFLTSSKEFILWFLRFQNIQVFLGRFLCIFFVEILHGVIFRVLKTTQSDSLPVNPKK